jgi:hypothetical protein
MLPTLFGRIQTRIFMLATVGSLVTLIMAAILPANGAPLHIKYQDAFVVLAAVAVLGVVWEFIYHFLMQWRWEKDWPTFFGFVTFLNEGIVVYLLARGGAIPGIYGRGLTDQPLVPFWFFWIDFLAVWIVVWLVVNGPFRVATIHWRFRGGRLV